VIDFIAVNLLARTHICDDEANTGRGSDGTPILVSESTHSGTLGLLNNPKFILAATVHLRLVFGFFCWWLRSRFERCELHCKVQFLDVSKLMSQ